MSTFKTFIECIFLCLILFTAAKGDASFPEDTYINALQNSHQTDVGAFNSQKDEVN